MPVSNSPVMRDASPLRYPGGKWRFAGFFSRLLKLNRMSQTLYVEPYAGGGSLALSLLLSGLVTRIHLNDLDPAIHSFWHSVLLRNEEFLDRMETVPVTPLEWARQKDIYRKGISAGRFDLGFATFFLNRTNHSGIMNGGMIGGKSQAGPWLLDARFNRPELMRRVGIIGKLKDRIDLTCVDAVDLLRTHPFGTNTMIYLDPPYFSNGRQLYMNAYKPGDHEHVRDAITASGHSWVVSYDDVRPIRSLYCGLPSRSTVLLHSARTAHLGREVLFFSKGLRIPRHVQKCSI